MTPRRTLWFALSAAALLVTIVPSCAIPAAADSDGPELPDKKSFVDNKVSFFMERRCGSLDCHGQLGRPLRIYSQWGLRRATSANGGRDNAATSTEEQTENYISVVGLEPELLAKCFNKDNPGNYSTFQLLKKPLGIEGGGMRHKGGPVLSATSNDKGWSCLYGWACNQGVDATQCDEAARLQ